MSAPSRMATIIAVAGSTCGGVIIGVGLAAFFYYLTRQPEEPLGHYRNPSPPPPQQRPSLSPSLRRRRSSPERRSIRAGSQPREIIPRTESTASNPRVRDRQREICKICSCDEMPNPEIVLLCGHIFHEECYTIWRQTVVMFNPDASRCPSC